MKHFPCRSLPEDVLLGVRNQREADVSYFDRNSTEAMKTGVTAKHQHLKQSSF